MTRIQIYIKKAIKDFFMDLQERLRDSQTKIVPRQPKKWREILKYKTTKLYISCITETVCQWQKHRPP